jgi:hypothetical protein
MAFLAGILRLPFSTLGTASCVPSVERLGRTTPWRFSIPDRIDGPAQTLDAPFEPSSLRHNGAAQDVAWARDA